MAPIARARHISRRSSCSRAHAESSCARHLHRTTCSPAQLRLRASLRLPRAPRCPHSCSSSSSASPARLRRLSCSTGNPFSPLFSRIRSSNTHAHCSSHSALFLGIFVPPQIAFKRLLVFVLLQLRSTLLERFRLCDPNGNLTFAGDVYCFVSPLFIVILFALFYMYCTK